MEIPKIIRHIWIGPKAAPIKWMRTWPELNPGWDYEVFDNAALERHAFRNIELIREYMKRGQYSGAADLIRYELLFSLGGFIAEADSVCLLPIDDLFRSGRLFTVYENEFVRGQLVSPILASEPGHPFLGEAIGRLSALSRQELENPWKTTGNLFMAKLIRELRPEIVIFPSHFLIPEHYTGVVYEGSGPIYARQFFASSRKMYRMSPGTALAEEARKLYRKHLAGRKA